MSVVIRMKRTGRRNAPCYRISVADRSKPRDGRTLDTLGVYDPISPVEELRLKLDVERARHWVLKGARPSETVHSIFQRSGVYEGVATKKARDRSGRKNETRTQTRRVDAKAKRAEAKSARRDERTAAKRAAKKAEAAAAAEGEES
ncbi:MAG: 30S ribosomal protein S16 [Planctomycetota bacterium]